MSGRYSRNITNNCKMNTPAESSQKKSQCTPVTETRTGNSNWTQPTQNSSLYSLPPPVPGSGANGYSPDTCPLQTCCPGPRQTILWLGVTALSAFHRQKVPFWSISLLPERSFWNANMISSVLRCSSDVHVSMASKVLSADTHF